VSASVTKSLTQAILGQLDQHNIQLDPALKAQLDKCRTEPRLPMPLQDALWRTLDAQRQPGLGLNIGASMLPQHFDTIGFLLVSSPSLSRAVDSLVDYSPIIGEGGKFSKLYTQSGWQLRYDAHFTDAVALRIEAIFASISVGAHWVAGKRITPVQIKFKHAQQTDIAAYNKVFGHADIQFSQAYNAMVFSDSDWNINQREVNPAVQAQMLALAKQQLTQLQPQNVVEKVSLLLTNQPWMTRAQLAASLAVSERTLSRKLSHGGACYKTLAQNIRKQYALTQVNNHEVTQASLADYLGYSDESAFAKAFKRWTGLGFRAYRQKHSLGRQRS